jgi:hypothetical protein
MRTKRLVCRTSVERPSHVRGTSVEPILSLFETEESERRENETAIFLFEGKLYKRLIVDRKLRRQINEQGGRSALRRSGSFKYVRLSYQASTFRDNPRKSRIRPDLGRERRCPILATIYSVFFVCR